MKGRDVVIALVVGGIVALLLWKGPTKVLAAVESFVMRALGSAEASRRAKLEESTGLALDSLRAELEEEHGIDTWIGSTLRTPKDQETLFKDGASATQNSWHLLGRAVDLYPMVDGKPDLDGASWDTLFRKMHEVAGRYGFQGLAFNADGTRRYITTSKGRKWDGGHLEFREGLTFAQAKARSAWGGTA